MENILLPLREDNGLQASYNQITKLCKYKKQKQINNKEMTCSEWLEVFDGELLFNNCQNKQNDQFTRASHIVKIILELNIKTICLFDGHGRMFYSIIKLLENPNDYKFIFFELDDQTHLWHKEFFPMKNCVNIHGNIFSYEIPNDYFVYLNFCGLGDNHTDIKTFVQTRTNTTMFSCSRRCPNKKKNKTSTLIHNLYRINGMTMKKMCNLGTFETFIITCK